MGTPLTQRLYIRIWLAVVAAIVLLTLIFGWIWREEAERERAQRPGREIILRNAQGEVLGQAQTRGARVPGQGWEFEVPLRDGQTVFVQLPRPGNRPPPSPPLGPTGLPPPYNLLVLLGLVAAAVALGAYPIVRRLTKRLETLQQGVERWGEGDLARRLPEDGQDEVAFLAQRFNIAAARVQALLLSHKALLANASHELRSPLARIRMGLELMQAQPSPATHEEMARNIRELDQLIDEILLASRLDASPDDLGPLEPVELVGLCAEECARTGAELEAPAGTTSVLVSGLTRLLRRALRNLLENARRHGGGEVTLTLQTQGAHVEIRVCDQGQGIPPALRERIFEPFFRLPGASEREGGVGLGLALVRSIAQRHGGTVHNEERPGGGACFVLRLPLTS
ncbi:HAMP domain-containing sensor histidine kinase [Curvibacter sp. PAE-UM]|uniref:sensor histidine kinase n=1 Tax=Curvibacter sp. PAE-UM TaxID=1714344 RepID=UPI00070F9628|nr:ATP-binding protein [Curvibacter sp. PAE-UM]KRH99469.1 histidine kinase [Curvibacter sp. PAE-UM]